MLEKRFLAVRGAPSGPIALEACSDWASVAESAVILKDGGRSKPSVLREFVAPVPHKAAREFATIIVDFAYDKRRRGDEIEARFDVARACARAAALSHSD